MRQRHGSDFSRNGSFQDGQSKEAVLEVVLLLKTEVMVG